MGFKSWWKKLWGCKEEEITLPPIPIEPVKPNPDTKWWRPTLEHFQILHFDSQANLIDKLDQKTRIVNIELDQIERYGGLSLVAKLHSHGVHVVAYFSASYEDWREDSDEYPEDAKGRKMSGWDELWPNLTKESLRDFLDKRMQRAKAIGCDGIEIDNTDIAWNDVGFDVTEKQNEDALIDLANRAHNLGLAIFLKNTPNLAEQLALVYDGAFTEEGQRYNEEEDYFPFVDQGKPLFMIEYSGSPDPVNGAIVHEKNGYFKDDYEVVE